MDKTYYAKGNYKAEIVGQGLTEASTGTLQVVLDVNIRPNKADQESKKRTIFLAVTDSTLEHLVPKLASAGYTRQTLNGLDLESAEACDIRGRIIDVYVKHELNKAGDMREKWDVSLPRKRESAGKAAVRAVDSKFGALMRAAGAVKATPVHDDDASDDNIPF